LNAIKAEDVPANTTIQHRRAGSQHISATLLMMLLALFAQLYTSLPALD
jgi:hypothetical protein